jgi:P pilus assembly chaperone PapD
MSGHSVFRRRFVPERARAIALALGVLAGSASSVRAQISVDELEVFLQPEGRTAGSIRVTNESDRVVQAFVEIDDWDRDDTGANRFFPSGTLPQSCRERLKVFPMTLRLEPRASETLRVTIDDAANAASCWGIVFVQANEPRPQLAGSGITYVIRTGIKVYVQRGDARRDGVIEEVRINGDEPGSTREAEVVFHNLGESHLKTRGTLEVRRSDNSVVAKLEVPEFPSVPGAVRRLKLELPAGLARGSYVALALLDYGGQEIAAGQIEFQVK